MRRIALPPQAGVLVLALIVAVVVGGLWLNHVTAPGREAAVHRRLAASGFTDVELRRAWVWSCPRRTTGYRWKAANGRGRACSDLRETVYVFTDERR